MRISLKNRPLPESSAAEVVGLAGDLTLVGDNGAVAHLTGSGTSFGLDVDNGAVIDAAGFEVEDVEIDADNGAVVTVCATRAATGSVDNGAVLTVTCGGDASGVAMSNGGVVG